MKQARTEMMFPPSIEECVKAAVDLGMPESEGRLFFFHYTSNGWKVGKVPMKSFAGAIGGWCERWKQRGGVPIEQAKYHVNGNSVSGIDKVNMGKEYDRILERMKTLRNVDSHADMTSADREEYRKLVARRNELRPILGIKI